MTKTEKAVYDAAMKFARVYETYTYDFQMSEPTRKLLDACMKDLKVKRAKAKK